VGTPALAQAAAAASRQTHLKGHARMKISGFSFCRNAQKLYYPLTEAIRSILPICDEFIVAVGKGDPDDHTREIIEQIGDPKIRIIDTEWTDRERLKGWVHSQQTNIALRECQGDWCFYVQADEVIHEKYLPVIRTRCEQLLDDREVDGLLFKYKHFWGDYDHYLTSHAAYPWEIRLIRNHAGVESWRSAQSFRRNGEKIRVAKAGAEVFHYGWVRPPRLMQKKEKELATTHHGKDFVENRDAVKPPQAVFDYGSLADLSVYRDTHPAVMREWISRFDWKDQLQYTGPTRARHKHHLPKYRLFTFIEQKIFGGRVHLGSKAYILLNRPMK
jgi:glycosyltransferase involved in cell wall biosynthesis